MHDGRDQFALERPRLRQLDHFPSALLTAPAGELWRHLDGPTLFHLPGRITQPLFVSVLLHGNEDTGWQAIQEALRHYSERGLPRSLLLFVGNIAAARANVRTLPHQTDYNRTWPGTLHDAAPESAVMREVVEAVARARPFASIDIHNNTGRNPHYACVNSLAEPFLHLARLFSRTVVYFERPYGVQSAALARICPSITVECGRIGGEAGVNHAAELVMSALAMQHLPEHRVADGDLDLLQTCAIVKVPGGASFSFDGAEAEFRFRADLDHLNFSELETGTLFGALGESGTYRLNVVAGGGHEISKPYFSYHHGEIRLARPAIPAMLTLDADAVRLDCLGYLMHRIGRDGKSIR